MPKQWARKYNRCVSCGTTKQPHEQHGYCRHCWSVKVYKKYKKYYKIYYKKYYRKNKKKLNARTIKYYHDHKPILVCQSPSK